MTILVATWLGVYSVPWKPSKPNRAFCAINWTRHTSVSVCLSSSLPLCVPKSNRHCPPPGWTAPRSLAPGPVTRTRVAGLFFAPFCLFGRLVLSGPDAFCQGPEAIPLLVKALLVPHPGRPFTAQSGLQLTG